ncbi:hypothetical protein A2313_03795 [Candidatus Roizmanbacteria bacterium RIFOXYB2_FULL_41_10]|nr:MAG: hypothetical protein A2313_03795 [Candidatus Roizmanbacteria bacterium RIFOXYB2_FULL_41_10]
MKNKKVRADGPFTKFKLKVGDWVWTQVPLNAKIIKVTKWGYVLFDGESSYSYYNDNEVEAITSLSKEE